jgi:hypothetical protein
VKALLACGIGLLLSCGTASAQDVRLNGLLDLRVVIPSGQESNLDGGLGKTRWGTDTGAAVRPEFGAAILRGTAQVTPDILLVGEIRSDAQQQTAIDIIDAFARWRPVSTTRWRWSVKLGAFFPPVSLENTGIGWTPEWTLTPSAINAWVGDELRTIGGEAMLEWRGDIDHFEWFASVYGWNQPAGVAIADRGWTFNDQPLGLLDHLRLPNAVAEQRAAPGQPYGALYSDQFRQISGSPGWYAGVAWERPDFGRVTLLRYDNMADPAAHDASEFAWRTKFWSLSGSTEIGDVVLLAQAMVGSTVIAPAPSFVSTTDFWGAYVLAGYERGDFRYALRFDEFGTSARQPGPGVSTSEHGFAGTAAVTWSARSWLKVVGEVLCADYRRAQRTLDGLPPHAIETQAQIAVRLIF